MPSTEISMEGVNAKNVWNIFGLLLNHQQICPCRRFRFYHIRSFELMKLKVQDTYIPESHW